MKFKTPENFGSISFDGKEITATDGVIEVGDDNADAIVAALLAHGCVAIADEPAAENEAAPAKKGKKNS